MEYGRTAGPYSSIAGNWIDSILSVCPFCKKLSAWEIAYGSKLSRIVMGAIPTERYFFRCQHCKAAISIPVAAILESEGGRGPSGFFTRAVLGTNFKIESVGDNVSFKRFLYTQCSLEALQNLAKQPRKEQERE